jgi:RNA polymerase sigma-70 factor (ECF subfamily)
MALTQQVEVFPETRWSLILRRPGPESGVSSETALNELCQMYWQPLYAYLRRSGNDGETAKDLVQAFLAHLLSKHGFQRTSPTQSRFRYFLMGALRNYLVSEGRKQNAAKRGGRVDRVPLDVEKAEEVFQTQAAEALTAQAAFDRQWAQTAWTRALQRLREEQRARGKERLFEALKPGLTEDFRPRHSEVASALKLPATTVALAVHRLRRRLKELVIDELSQTVGTHGDLDDELAYFLSIWSQ